MKENFNPTIEALQERLHHLQETKGCQECFLRTQRQLNALLLKQRDYVVGDQVTIDKDGNKTVEKIMQVHRLGDEDEHLFV